nr:RNA-directed DNA polymerase [uncultured Lachnoclostridium sp.]
MLSDISGLRKHQVYNIGYRYGIKAIKPFIEILIDVIRSELLNKSISFPPIWYKDKVDPSSHKVRHIGIQNVKQQIYDYIAIEGLKPFFCRIGVHQYASIKDRGCVKGSRMIQRWMRNKSLKYFAKLDIKKCYPSIPQDKLIEFLDKHIKNDMLMWLIEELISTFETGLSIGSFLSQYLCNLYLSQIYHFIGHLHKERKHKNGTRTSIRLVYHRLFYMDDIFMTGTSAKDIHKAVKEVIKYCKSLGLKVKESWFVQKMAFADRKSDKTFIDMMGFRIYRTHITIRRYVFKRIRRLAIRLWRRIKTHQKVLESHARKIISYWGLLKNSNSVKVIQKYHIKDIMKICKKVVRQYDKIKIYGKTTTCYGY